MALLATMTDDQTRSGFRLLPAGFEEDHFKRVPEGWLLTVKSPRFLGFDWSYQVIDMHKQAIAARLGLACYLRFIIVLAGVTALIVMGPKVLRWPTGPAVWLGFIVWMYAINVCDYLCIRTLLGGVQRTSETVTPGDRMRSRAEAMSVGALVTFMVISFTGVVGSVAVVSLSVRGPAVHGTPGDALVFVALIGLSITVAIYWSWVLAIKLSARRR